MKRNQNTEVIEVEAEEMLPEVPLEKKIEQELVKANITEKVIAALKETYGGMKLKAIDDKETYLEISAARKIVRKVGIITEDICKKGRESAVKEQRLWLAKQSEILKKIGEVQDPLDAEIKKFEDEVERKEIEEKKRQEEIYINRQATLSKYGATYNNGSFELKHISYEVELIKQADDEQWNDTILPKYRKVYEEVEAERVAEETKRKEEADRLKAEQDKFAEDQRKFREQQEEFTRQQKTLQEQKDEVDRKERERKKQEQKEIDAANEEKLKYRISKLPGWSYNGVTVSDHGNIFGSKEEFLALTTKEFESKAADNELYEETLRKIAEKKRLDDIELEKQKAAQQEREKIQEEQRQVELKKQQDEQRRLQELELAGDKSKYEDLISYLKKYPKHAMKSNMYKGKVNAISLYIDNL